MTDVEAKTPPKRKNLSNVQDKKNSAKKAKLENIKTLQKGISPKQQIKKKQGNVQSSPQKFNKKNKKNSESENDSPKKLKPFPGTQSTNDDKEKGEKLNKIGERKRRRGKNLQTLVPKVKAGDKEAIKNIEDRIQEIESRGELTKSAKKKLTMYKKLQKIARGEPLGQSQSQKAVQNKPGLTKTAKKPPQTQGVLLKKGAGKNAQISGVKINGNNKNLKTQNKLAAKKTIPQKQLEEDEEDESDSDEDEQDIEDEDESGEEEQLEDESGEEDVEGESDEGAEAESNEDVEGESDEEESDDNSDEESPPPAKVEESDEDEDDISDAEQLYEETELSEEDESDEQELDEESDEENEETGEYSAHVKNKRKNNTNDEPSNKKQKQQNTDTKKGGTVDLEQLKKNNLVAKNQKRFVLFVGNIPYDTNKQDLIEHFKKSGEVKHIRIPTEKKSSKPRGFAYVELANEESYQKGLSMHHTFLKGRRINVLYTQGGKKKGDDKKKEIKAKNFKLHAMRKQGQLAGSIKQTQKRSFRRAKQKKNKVNNEEQ